jgi:uncharacterized protein
LSLDISPLIPTGRQVIQGYRGGIFRISQIDYKGPVIVLPDHTVDWPAPAFADLAIADFDPILGPGTETAVQVLLLGCGDKMLLPPPPLRKAFKDRGIVIEPMDTGAACRTFNVLMGEDRRVAAALLPAS